MVGRKLISVRAARSFMALAVMLSSNSSYAQAVAATTTFSSPIAFIQTIEPQNNAALNVEIQSVEPGQEGQVLESVIDEHPESTITVFHDGQDPETVEKIEKIADGHSVYTGLQIVEIDTQIIEKQASATVQSQSSTEPKLIGKWKSRARRAVKFGKGLLMTLGTAGSFSGSYYFFTGDLPLSVKLFGVATVVNGFQILGTEYWTKYLHKGGEYARKFYAMTAKVLGKTVQAGRVSDGVGRVMAAFGFNLATATAILGLQGAVDSALWVMALGAMGTWDAIWDLVLDRHIELGSIKEKHLERFIRVRLLLGPPVEALAYSGTPVAIGAAAAMAVIGTTGLVSFFTADQLKSALEKRRMGRGVVGRAKMVNIEELASAHLLAKVGRSSAAIGKQQSITCEVILEQKLSAEFIDDVGGQVIAYNKKASGY